LTKIFNKTLLTLIAALFVLFSCSQHKNTYLSRTYHGTTAHYNAYFLAREKMKEIDKQIIKESIDDYNKVLPVYPTIKENTKTAIKPGLDEVIKKAALINEKHKNSQWLDDSYVIIGKSEMYKGEYPEAIEFFKYVNTISKDPIPRHAAIILLMRTFITIEDYENASLVSDYMKKETPNKKNQKDLFLTQALYHQIFEEYDKALVYLNSALPLIKKGEEKSRICFIIGQINQMNNKNKEAFTHYRQTLKNNPTYELSFYARLNLAQVTELSKANDKKRIQRYFKKLLKDKKNEEYKDKIYYEMALFEIKQENVDKGISFLEKSLRVNTSNVFQKGRSYLKLGEIYYEKESFQLAKYYYDSTIAVWDKKEKDYKKIASRQKILAEFVKQLTIIQREDSLQRLAKMDTASLSKFIDNMISKEEDIAKKEKEREEKAKEEKANNQNQSPAIVPGNNTKWYFGNAIAITQGSSDFLKKWGKRKLEDNWRRSTKEATAIKEEEVKEENVVKTITEKPDENKKNNARKIEKQNRLRDLPYTPAQMEASEKKVEEAMYELGKIYNLKLNEKKKAIKTFDKFIERFPNSEHSPEVLYFLYLIYKDKGDPKFNLYKDKLLKDFPRSVYTKTLLNPNYINESKVSNKKAAEKYKQAYELYEKKLYIDAEAVIRAAKIESPESDIDDKLTLLSILITGKTKNALVYKSELEEFIANYSNSLLIPKALELLKTSKDYILHKTGKGDSIKTNDVIYIKDIIKLHYCVFSFPKGKVKTDVILNEFISYDKKLFKLGEIQEEYVPLNDSIDLFIIKTFSGKFSSENYLLDILEKKSFINKYSFIDYKGFIISKENYQLLINSKNLNLYLKFFKENY
jgi:tetratricopeptide (TPR) repeat protein